MNSTARTTLIGAGAGAALMFLVDPARGNRRRALIKDKMMLATRKTRDAAGATRRDLRNRWEGAAATLQSRFGRGETGEVDDRVIGDRVRAELGRVCSHPRAIRVSVADGRVALSGDVLASEVSSVVSQARSVRGVIEVEDLMVPYASAAGIPSLQGESQRPGQWSTWLRSSWSPTAIVAAGIATSAIAIAATTANRARPTA